MASSQSSRRRAFAVSFLALVPTLALAACALAACGDDAENVALPIFEGGPNFANGSEGGEAGTDDGGDAAIANDGEVTDTSTNSDSSTDGATSGTNLVISQVQSRGTAGGNDEFIEIYNPTADAITFDATWSVTDRNATSGLGSCTTAATTLYTGTTGQTIASHKHLLLTTATYSGSPAGDGTYSANISDAASLVLVHSGTTIDALCFSYDATTELTLTTCATPYICEGLPATNPHDNTTGTDTNASLERKPGGTGGNGIDSNVNANDFASVAADDPHDLGSAAVP